jgi:predicted dehydrogenase
MRIGIIGLGRAGLVHLKAWQGVAGATIASVADPSPTARRTARAAGLRTYADPFTLIARERLDAVSICTPPTNHAALAVACLERGLHVLCEKPLATTATAALHMLRTAARTRRHLLLATKFRHVPDLERARELLAGGAIGEPVAFEIDFSSMVDMSARWNCRRGIAGGGVIIDNGCHAFDIVAFLFGTVSRVQAARLKQVQPIGVEDSAAILVAAGRGLIGRIDLSWSLATGRATYVTVYGSRGTIEVGWRGSRLRIPGEPDREIGPGYDKNDAHGRMFTRFTQVVAGSGQPWISAGECLRTVAAVEAAYRSLRSGTWTPVDMLGMRTRVVHGRRRAEARA